MNNTKQGTAGADTTMQRWTQPEATKQEQTKAKQKAKANTDTVRGKAEGRGRRSQAAVQYSRAAAQLLDNTAAKTPAAGNHNLPVDLTQNSNGKAHKESTGL